jgi:hypothetical protein
MLRPDISFIQTYRWFPSILQVLTIIRPETLVRWRRAGFRCYRCWKHCDGGAWSDAESSTVLDLGELRRYADEPASNFLKTNVSFRAGPPSYMLAAIAAENAKGRKLLIITTNLDTQRTVSWDMGPSLRSGPPRC